MYVICIKYEYSVSTREYFNCDQHNKAGGISARSKALWEVDSLKERGVVL